LALAMRCVDGCQSGVSNVTPLPFAQSLSKGERQRRHYGYMPGVKPPTNPHES